MLRFLIPAAFLMITGCQQTTGQEDELFHYKDSYVGDSGALGNITRRLPRPDGEHLEGIELKTTEKPYGIILNYTSAESEGITTKYHELTLSNGTMILALVKNADWVQFNYLDGSNTVTRESLENWYGKDISEFSNEDELSEFVQPYLEDETKVDQFFLE
ncbi:DUF4825 domain-containing protein [Bacillus sp. KH172YL63]|uniref:DUF4825 domain-containing protein n=1 Tax=Bacillus sp. KH172YL63 TaxID=2709784 RepID=UPI001565D12D|nr:DUF4825 domain-containing protein [Bacillus sp. KH172YL63]